MRKNIFTGILVAVMLVVAGGVLPSVTSAQSTSTDQLQAQINALLEQIRILKNQLSALEVNRPVLPVPPALPVVVQPLKHRICSALYRNLAFNSQGDDVRGLQEFLRLQGHLTVEPTGFFGTMTSEAVAKWQKAEGVSAVGSFGPISRERAKKWCNDGTVVSNTKLIAVPMSGQVPLTVDFKANVSIANPQMLADAGSYKITFGDGSEHVFSCTGLAGRCPGPHTVQHTYAANGTYTASLILFGYYGHIIDPPEKIIESVVISVGQPTITNPNNRPPVVTSFSGPTTLSVDGTGMWSVQASDPENDQLTYSILWGDERYARSSSADSSYPSAPAVQSTTFTHSYANAGAYVVSILVRDTSGNATRTTASVHVGRNTNTVCSADFAPVCGRPPGCVNTCGAGLYCSAICALPTPITYPNRCTMDAAGSTFIHNDTCTATSSSTPETPVVVMPPSRHRICSALYRDLVRGLQGDDVRSLQEFLVSQGHLSANPTGFFGAMTSEAVSLWQRIEGVPALGLFGPLSRERIRGWCERDIVVSNEYLTATPVSGGGGGCDDGGGRYADCCWS